MSPKATLSICPLGRTLGRLWSAVASLPLVVIAKVHALHAARQKGEWVGACFGAVEPILALDLCVSCAAEGRLSGRVTERVLRNRARRIAGSHPSHLREATSGSTHSARHTVLLRWLGKGSTGSKGICAWSITGSRRAGHGTGPHAVLGRRWSHLGGEALVNHDRCARSGCTTAQAVDVLGEVVVGTAFGTASPVSSAERYHTCPAATVMAHSVTVVAHVRRMTHHVRGGVTTVAKASIRVGTRPGRGEGAAETGSPSLEIREAA